MIRICYELSSPLLVKCLFHLPGPPMVPGISVPATTGEAMHPTPDNAIVKHNNNTCILIPIPLVCTCAHIYTLDILSLNWRPSADFQSELLSVFSYLNGDIIKLFLSPFFVSML